MALPTASDNVFPKVTFVEGAAPSSPAATNFKVYFDSSDHLPKFKNSSGTVTTFATSGFADPMTTRGDTIIRNSSNVTARLGVGGASQVIKSDGTDVSWNYLPRIAVFAYMSTTQSFNATTLTYITLDSEAYDTNVFHDNTTNNSRLTAPITGTYCVAGGIWYATTSGTNYLLFDKNHGGVYIRGGAIAVGGTASGCSLTTDVALTAGDYIEMVGYHTQAGSIATGDTGTTPSQQNWMTMKLIGV
jgi:hypothetical protein